MIKPALRRAWRDRETVQYGAAPAHAVLLGPIDNPTAGFLDLLDGTRGLEQLRRDARALGLGEGAADRLTQRLAAAGVLDDATAERAACSGIGDRLRPDMSSLSAVHREQGAGPRRLAARRETCVQVRGAGRVGATIATTLSAAGVGRVEVRDGGEVQPWDTSPGGLPAGSVGERRREAAEKAVNAVRPWSAGPEVRGGPRLVVLAPRDGLGAYAPDPDSVEGLLESGTPHLYAGVVEGTGVLGPLVLPGRTPCADCMMRCRAEREPGWPLVVGQWRTGARRRSGVPACDTALATVVAGMAASYALGFLDGDGGCTAGYRVRVTLPHLLPDTEALTPHSACPCGAASVPGGRPPSADPGPQSTMAG
ncbi:ThiF family adenylyltransferase [Streptomyces sp. ODS28]|uniref:ThiF family adenylyltransferase n=1 Tax=Streptomyces sp. ODS28 TaxID=3136688 RepID=UPI0031E9FA17